MFEKKPKRFAVKYKESQFVSTIEIMVDRETGVNYLMITQGEGFSVTPLLDSNGQVVRDKPENWQNEFYDQ